MGQRDLYVAEDPSDVGTGDTIDSVVLHYWSASLSGTYKGKTQGVIKTNGVEYTGTLHSNVPTSFTEYTDTWVNNPQTGSEWTLTELNNIEVGVENTSGKFFRNAYGVATTAVRLKINYTPAPVTLVQRTLVGVGV